MPSSIIAIDTNLQPIAADNGARKRVTHAGGSALFYGSTASAAQAHESELTAAAEVTLKSTTYFVSAGLTNVIVAEVDPEATRVELEAEEAARESGDSGDAALGPTVNTGTILQGIGGYDPDGDGIENITGPNETKLSTGGLYADSGEGNLFHSASYVENTGSRATVAVLGFGKGKHVFGGNFVGYTDGADHAAIGVEIDFGNLNEAAGGEAHGLIIRSLGGNIGGQGGQAYVQMQAAASSSADHGIIFNKSEATPAVASTGSLVKAAAENCDRGLNFTGSLFTTAAAFLPVNSGSTTASQGVIFSAEGGFANAGCFIDFRSGAASSSVTDGLRFRVSSERQPVTGSLIKALTGIQASIGLDLVGGTFSAAGIAMGSNNISASTTTGMKIGTGSTQKIGFWGAAPVARPAALTAISAEAIDATYGEQEQKVLENLKKRSEEVESRMKEMGLIA